MASNGNLRFSRYYRQASSNYAFDSKTVLWLSIPFLFTNLVVDFPTSADLAWRWLFVAAIGYVVVLVLAFAIGALYKKLSAPTWFYLPTFYLIGMFRGAVIYFLGRELGVVPWDDFAYRVFGSGAYAFSLFSIFAILVSNFDRASKTMRELEAQQLRRAKRLNTMKREIAEQNSEIVGRVNGIIAPAISNLITRLNVAKSGEIGEEINALKNTVDNLVRPISHSVGTTSTPLSEPVIELNSIGLISASSKEIKFDVSALLLPIMSAFLLTLLSAASSLNVAGFELGLPAIAIIGISSLFFIFITKQITSDLKLPAFSAWLVTMIPYASVAGVASLWFMSQDRDLFLLATPRLFALTIVLGTIFFRAQSAYQILVMNNDALKIVNDELNVLNAQAKQELWVNRRRIATVLHGPVQAALYSSAMRLAQTKRPTKKLIKEINEELTQALSALKFDSSSSASVKSVLQDISDVWSGVCEVYISVPKKVHDVVNRNPNVAEAFNEVVREAVSNAIKHGGAKDIEISAKVTKGIIYLQVTNNGKAPSKKQASDGYGTQILNELTLKWELTPIAGGKVQFNAAIVAEV